MTHNILVSYILLIPEYNQNNLYWDFKNIYQRYIKRFKIIYFKIINYICVFKGYYFKIGVGGC